MSEPVLVSQLRQGGGGWADPRTHCPGLQVLCFPRAPGQSGNSREVLREQGFPGRGRGASTTQVFPPAALILPAPRAGLFHAVSLGWWERKSRSARSRARTVHAKRCHVFHSFIHSFIHSSSLHTRKGLLQCFKCYARFCAPRSFPQEVQGQWAPWQSLCRTFHPQQRKQMLPEQVSTGAQHLTPCHLDRDVGYNAVKD